ncbi:MAG TPA: hypothetical protein VFU10_07615 [Gaiellaceae bacterium]|nr:hypothetical protein [Gaiellaceae bacterium]
MRKPLVLAAACAVLLVGIQSATAAPADVICTDAFSGTARDVMVPSDNECDLSGATVARDVVVGPGSAAFGLGLTVGRDVVVHRDSGIFLAVATIGHDLIAEEAAEMHLERTTIGHDLSASQPQTVQTGHVAPETAGGPVFVGHDVTIDGSPDLPFVFDGICDLHVGYDFSVTNRSVTLGFGIGNICAGNGLPSNTIGHDMVVTGNTALVGFFGPSSLKVGANHVGHDLVFSNNTAALGGTLEVSANIVGHDATCAANDPAVTVLSPNIASHSNSCG